MIVMSPKAWTLLAISVAGENGLSPVQIQKALFLLGKELSADIGDGFYAFEPYNYGPFCKVIYGDAEDLADEGLVVVSSRTGMNRRYSHFTITPSGQQQAGEVERSAPPKAVSYLRAVVAWAQSQTFSGLIRAIYQKYPEYRENSVFSG